MNRFWPWLAILVLLLAIGGVYLIQKTPFQADQEAAVRSLVTDFGATLKNVSLLAARQDVVTSMQKNYSRYVSSDLLGAWENDPLNAPGRLTSSPWPERIEIKSIQKENDTKYTVEGEIVEVSSEGGGIGEEPSESARRSIMLTVEKSSDGWRITGATLSASASDGDWKYTDPDSHGIQFMYPEKLPTTYISPQKWPPQVTLTSGTFSCAPTTDVGPQGQVSKTSVGDRTYCVTQVSEGAAGSTYTTYEYVTSQGDLPAGEAGFLADVTFTLRFPQCLNYDDPQKTACAQEQASFDIDGLVDRIASSIRMQ